MSKSRTLNNQVDSLTTGVLFVLSAPSGAGKLTVLNKVRKLEPKLLTTVSATTRAPRTGEKHTVDYYFIGEREFESHIKQDAFIEWANVHGNYYGTLKSELERCRRDGNDVLLEVDVQGMRNIKSLYPEMISIFMMPPSLEELARRLQKRGTDSEETIALRLKNAEEEMAARNEFDYVVVNDKLEDAVNEIRNILAKERAFHAQSTHEMP